METKKEHKTLTFTKVGENKDQRFYKLSTPVTEVPNPDFSFDEYVKDKRERVYERFQYLIPDKIEYICVSDAHTHIERLVFIAVFFPDKDQYDSLGGQQIDGKHTMMIHGGSSRDVHPDEVYLRRLSSANNMKMKLEK